MHAAIVEFDTLPDPVRPRAQYHHRPIAGLRCFVFVFERRVVIRRRRHELGGARVHGLERGGDVLIESDPVHRLPEQVAELGIRVSMPFCGPDSHRIGAAAFELGADLDDLGKLIHEPRVVPRRACDVAGVEPASQCLGCQVDAVG